METFSYSDLNNVCFDGCRLPTVLQFLLPATLNCKIVNLDSDHIPQSKSVSVPQDLKLTSGKLNELQVTECYDNLFISSTGNRSGSGRRDARLFM